MRSVAQCVALVCAGMACVACSDGKPLAAALVQQGKTITWPDGRKFLVENRKGNQLEKVRLIQPGPAGVDRVVEADRAELSKDADGRTVRVTLHDAVLQQNGRRVGTIKVYSIICMQ